MYISDIPSSVVIPSSTSFLAAAGLVWIWHGNFELLYASLVLSPTLQLSSLAELGTRLALCCITSCISLDEWQSITGHYYTSAGYVKIGLHQTCMMYRIVYTKLSYTCSLLSQCSIHWIYYLYSRCKHATLS